MYLSWLINTLGDLCWNKLVLFLQIHMYPYMYALYMLTSQMCKSWFRTLSVCDDSLWNTCHGYIELCCIFVMTAF